MLSVSGLGHAVNVSTSTAHDAADTGAVGAPAAGRLLDAAAKAFADKGFHATTTRDIASRAGLSATGVYVHFESKEDLLFALTLRGHEAALRLVRGACEGTGSAAVRLSRVMSRFSRWHAEHYEMARVVQYEFTHLSPEHRDDVLALRKQTDAALRDLITEGVRAGEFALDDVRDTALALTSLCVDVARWYSPAISRSPEQIGRMYGELGLRLVGASR